MPSGRSATAFFGRATFFRRLAVRRSERYKALLVAAGAVGNPYSLALRTIGLTVLLLPLVPLGILLSLAFGPIPLLAVAGPAFPTLYYSIKLRDGAVERAAGIEKELPYLAVISEVLHGSGASLFDAFEGMIHENVLVSVRREALLLNKYVSLEGINPVEAFEKLAKHHPSGRFAEFLFGYTSVLRSGGDAGAYLLTESQSLLEALEERWARYGERAGTVGSITLTLFVMVPALILVTSLFEPEIAILYLSIFVVIGIPTMTVLILLLASKMQPPSQNPMTGRFWRSVVLASIGVLPGLATGQVWLALASTASLFSVLYGISVLEQRRQMSEIERELPHFLRDLLEYKKQERDMPSSIQLIQNENQYKPGFQKLLRTVATQARGGKPLEDIQIQTKSQAAKMVFYVLGKMAGTGGGTVDTLRRLSIYTSRVVEAKRKGLVEMKPYLYIAYLSPVLLAVIVSFVVQLLGIFGSRIAGGFAAIPSSAGSFSTLGQLPPDLLQFTNMLIITASAALGVISAKMVDFTVKNTLRVAANVMVAIVAIFVLSHIQLGSIL